MVISEAGVDINDALMACLSNCVVCGHRVEANGGETHRHRDGKEYWC